MVSKRLKSFLQRAETMWRISPNGEIADTYKNITNVIYGDTVDTLKMIAVGYKMRNLKTPFPYRHIMTYGTMLWKKPTNISSTMSRHTRRRRL